MKRVCASCLAVIVLVTSLIWAGALDFVNAKDDPEAKTETEEAIEKNYPNLLSSKDSDGTLSKEETVYVIMDADSKIKDVSVSEWLKNGKGESSINDVSTLKDIENTANDKAFTRDGNKLVWDADGSDIKYKGSTDKDLPVDVGVSYYLDGEKMSASEIAGKSGHVTISFSYLVNDKTESNGYTFYTPYTMASGVLLNDEHFTDISVDGGKVIDDGSKCICLGIAFPGLTSNLNTDLSSLDIPESVNIEAYTDKFEIDGTYTVALTGMFSDLDLSGADSVEGKISELTDAFDRLGQAADKLVSGAGKVSDGASELNEKAGDLKKGAHSVAGGSGTLSGGLKTLFNGAKTLADGAEDVRGGSKDLKDGTGQLKEGSSSLADGTGQLKTGADNLSAGTGQLKEGSETLSKGTENLKSGVDSLAQGAADLGSGVQNLVDGEAQVDTGMSQLDAGLKGLSSGGDSGSAIVAASEQYQRGMEAYAAAMQAMIDSESDPKTKAKLEGLKSKIPMPDSYTAAVKSYVSGVDQVYAGEQAVYAGEQQVFAGMKELQGKLPALTEGISGLQKGASDLNDGAKNLANGAAAADSGAKALASGAESADNGAKSLARGATSLDEGAKQLADGTSELSSGAVKIRDGSGNAYEGSKTLTSGANELASGTDEFKKGTSKLAAGAEELYEGIYAFNRDGIEKLISTMNDADIDGLLERVRALADASSKGKFVGGKADNMNGESRIIFKSDTVKA